MTGGRPQGFQVARADPVDVPFIVISGSKEKIFTIRADHRTKFPLSFINGRSHVDSRRPLPILIETDIQTSAVFL